MEQYTLSQDALLQVIQELSAPHPDPWLDNQGAGVDESPEPLPWRSDFVALVTQAALSRIAALNDLKAVLPEEFHEKIDGYAMSFAKASYDDPPFCLTGWPRKPIPLPRRFKDWVPNPLERIKISAAFLESGLPQAVSVGQPALGEAVAQLNKQGL